MIIKCYKLFNLYQVCYFLHVNTTITSNHWNACYVRSTETNESESISLEFFQRRWLRRYQVNSLWNVHPKSPDHQITKPFTSSISIWLWLLLGCWIEMFEFPIFKILGASITRICLILVFWVGVFSLDKPACFIIRFVFGFCICLSSQICSLFIFRDFQENEWQKLWKPSEVKFKRDTLRYTKRDTLRIVCL